MLAVCLSALAGQTRPADEIVVVDNASTDKTAAICAAAGARRIAVELPGIAACTAHGFDEARCELIARLDTDSIPPADWLERVEAVLEKEGPLSAVSGPVDFYGGNGLARWAGRSVYIAGYFWAIGWARFGGAGAGGNGNGTTPADMSSRRIRRARSGRGSFGAGRSHSDCARPGRPRCARR